MNNNFPNRKNKKKYHHKRPNSNEPKSNKIRSKLSVRSIYQEHDQLLKKIFTLRKKLFEQFFKLNHNTREQLEKNYIQALSDLQHFKRNIPSSFKGILNRIYPNYPEDNGYSKDHPEEKSNIPATRDELIHILPSQKDRPTFKEDKDESTGTMSDYTQYRSEHGLSTKTG